VLGEVVDFTFLRWNRSHEYNIEMNDNDVADQLQLVYRLHSASTAKLEVVVVIKNVGLGSDDDERVHDAKAVLLLEGDSDALGQSQF